MASPEPQTFLQKTPTKEPQVSGDPGHHYTLPNGQDSYYHQHK